MNTAKAIRKDKPTYTLIHLRKQIPKGEIIFEGGYRYLVHASEQARKGHTHYCTMEG